MQEERPGLKRMVEIPGTGGNLLTKVWLRCPVWKMKHIWLKTQSVSEIWRKSLVDQIIRVQYSDVFNCIQDQCMQLRKGGQPAVVQSHWQIEIWDTLRPMCLLNRLSTKTIENKSVSQWPFLQYPAVSSFDVSIPLDTIGYHWIPLDTIGYPLDSHG